MPALPYSITISDEERAYLKSLIKTRTIQAQVVDRARMLLWKSEAKTDKAIADGLGVSVNTARLRLPTMQNHGLSVSPAKSPVTLAMPQNYGHWLRCINIYRCMRKKQAIHV